VLRPSRDEAAAELGEHAEVEAGSVSSSPSAYFQSMRARTGVGGLPVAQVLEELEDRDQGQPPRREAGLAPGGVELRKSSSS
jgi:hypothetical protein